MQLRKIAFSLFLSAAVGLAGAQGVLSAKIAYTEAGGRTVSLSPRPKRVVVLLNSLLDLWYMSGGTAVGRVNGTTNVPPEAFGIEDLGTFASPNAEKLFALKPDLVIFSGTSSAQLNLRELVDRAKIESVSVSYDNYDDFPSIVELFTRITGRNDVYERVSADVSKKVDSIVARAPRERGPSLFILFSTTKALSAELPTTDTGSIAARLGGRNVVSSSPIKGADRIDFSMEDLIVADPEVILIATMGDVELCKARIAKEFSSNAAWGGLRAVKNGRVHYLPKDLFMYKANARYPEAFEYMARLLYPGVFGHAE
jgi:iron complex transport system substrate-binding protein